VKNFEHHIAQLEALGFQLERGMLIGAGRFTTADQIGTRFATATAQIDTYTRESFFEADKAQPLLGESQVFAGPEGEYIVTPLLRA
jgi:hypothetical protein